MNCLLCAKPSYVRGLCSAHYSQALRGRIPLPPKLRKVVTVCSLCGELEYAKGLCHPHYLQEYTRQNAERLSKQRKQWREDNHEALLEAKRLYREANAVELAEKQKAYAKSNPDIVKRLRNQSERRRRARLAGVNTENITDAEMLLRWGTDCYLCGEEIDLEAPRRSGQPGWQRSLWRDHVIPVSRSGHDTLDNVRPTHAICNLRKGSR
jgi:5-methylcytosine-specific restriction endonuclease McrA